MAALFNEKEQKEWNRLAADMKARTTPPNPKDVFEDGVPNNAEEALRQQAEYDAWYGGLVAADKALWDDLAERFYTADSVEEEDEKLWRYAL